MKNITIDIYEEDDKDRMNILAGYLDVEWISLEENKISKDKSLILKCKVPNDSMYEEILKSGKDNTTQIEEKT